MTDFIRFYFIGRNKTHSNEIHLKLLRATQKKKSSQIDIGLVLGILQNIAASKAAISSNF